MLENYVAGVPAVGMDMLNVKPCPVCGSPHDTYGGVAMHMVKMSDSAHSHIETKDEGLEYLVYEGSLVGCNHGVEAPKGPVDGALGYA